MADVHAAAFRRPRHQRGQLGSFGVGRRGVDQRRADAHRAFLHRLPDERAHARELRRGRIDVLFAKLVHADGGRPDERREVRSDALALHIVEILAEGGPADRIFDVALPLDRALLHLRRPRAHRIAFAHHLERDALHGVAEAAAVGDQALVGPAEHVDEAGRDRLAGRHRRSALPGPGHAGRHRRSCRPGARRRRRKGRLRSHRRSCRHGSERSNWRAAVRPSWRTMRRRQWQARSISSWITLLQASGEAARCATPAQRPAVGSRESAIRRKRLHHCRGRSTGSHSLQGTMSCRNSPC